ncbi:hypothetical protein RIF29_20173 [Crotalaria pallida]|uniref:DUF4378 domain-containing protein n=1 Tax=Crotalaria pallida TaxID=3830 RepID=A0AAN9F956_CROPI
MSKEKDSKHNLPNVVAKLMGLEALSGGEPNLAMERSQIKDYPQHMFGLHLGSPFNKEVMPMLHDHHHKDIYEIWLQRSQRIRSYVRDKKKMAQEEDVDDGKRMALIHQKFMEAKRMSTDERLRKSKQFEDALEVLSSNSDALVKLLDELHCAPAPAPPAETNIINLLKPLKMVDNNDNAGKSSSKSDGQIKKPANVVENKNNVYSSSASKEVDEFLAKSTTKIVVLKPSFEGIHELNKGVVSPTTSSTRNFQSGNSSEGLETLCSSAFSNRGDESSFKKQDHDDFEAMSTLSTRHSWDTIQGCGGGSAYYSPETSVSREAKKRLYERWTMMASSNNNKGIQEQRNVKRSSTLLDMLSLSHIKKSIASSSYEIEGITINEDQEEPTTFASCCDSSSIEEISIHGSDYVTASSSVACETELRVEVYDHDHDDDDAGKAHGSKVLTKPKSSFKGKIMSFLFSRKKKLTKKKSSLSQSSVSETSVSSAGLFRDDVSQSFNSFEECSLPSLCGSFGKPSSDTVSNGQQQGMITLEPGLIVSKTMMPEISSEHHDQPSPISVLDPPFEDDNAYHVSVDYKKKGGHLGSRVPMKTNLIDKSPPIESIARTLSWNDSCSSEVASSNPCKPFMVSSLDTKVEEQEWLLLVEKLLSAAGLDDQVEFDSSFYTRWHSLESPLDPSLRDRYAHSIILNGKETLQHEAKRRRKMRSNQMLVFDCVNAALLEITTSDYYGSEKYLFKRGMCSGTHRVQEGIPYMMDHIVAQMKELIASEVECVWGDGGYINRLVVENVVRKEVVGIGWVELMGLEVDNMVREIEKELIQELVENVVDDFTCRA